MKNLPTEVDVIRKNIKDIEEQRDNLQKQLGDMIYMLKKLNDRLDKIEKKQKSNIKMLEELES